MFSIKLTINRTIWVEKTQKNHIFPENKYKFSPIVSTNNYMWIYSNALAETIIFPHKTKVEIVHKSNPTKTSTIIVENTENLPNSSFYTIEYKIVRNSHLLSQNWHFLKCHSNCSTNKHKLLTHKVIKAAIDCSYIYWKGNMAKFYKHTLLSSNTLLSSWVLKSQLTFSR